jgi:hypothetical protein
LIPEQSWRTTLQFFAVLYLLRVVIAAATSLYTQVRRASRYRADAVSSTLR